MTRCGLVTERTRIRANLNNLMRKRFKFLETKPRWCWCTSVYHHKIIYFPPAHKWNHYRNSRATTYYSLWLTSRIRYSYHPPPLGKLPKNFRSTDHGQQSFLEVGFNQSPLFMFRSASLWSDNWISLVLTNLQWIFWLHADGNKICYRS